MFILIFVWSLKCLTAQVPGAQLAPLSWSEKVSEPKGTLPVEWMLNGESKIEDIFDTLITNYISLSINPLLAEVC